SPMELPVLPPSTPSPMSRTSSSLFPPLSPASATASLNRFSSSSCNFASCVPSCGRKQHSLWELNVLVIGTPSRVSRWYEFRSRLTTRLGGDQHGRSLCSVLNVYVRSLQYTCTS